MAMRQCGWIVVVALVVVALGVAQAAPVGHWRFEGTAGGAAGAIPNVLSPGTLDAVGQGGATYSGNIAGPTIWDPISNTVYSNATSLDVSGGKLARVADDPALDAASFTIETLVRLGSDQTSYPNYLSHRVSSPARGWQLDIDPQEDARTRFDTAAQSNQTAGSGSKQSLADFRWHHTAVTFDAATQRITHYTDYGVTATRTLNGSVAEATTVAADLIFGAIGSTAQMDEVRYSNSVLSNTQFLRPVNNALWRFEGTPGTAIGTVPNAFSPGHLDGQGEGGELYAADVPAVSTLDPLTGIYRGNTSSLDLSTAGRVRVLDDDELDASAFTVECFVKVQNQTGYPNFVTRLDLDDAGWQLDVNPSEYARARIDTGSSNNQVVGSTTAQSLADGDWHHVALTFDGATARLYVDYANMASKAIAGSKFNVNSVANDLLFGDSIWPAGSYLDEVRFSAAPLGPDQFLIAVAPEPATLALLALGGLGLLARRRRVTDGS
ncbi:LamG-like jellyroll fold domain-containing protein [Planctomycetota bacterium]